MERLLSSLKNLEIEIPFSPQVGTGFFLKNLSYSYASRFTLPTSNLAALIQKDLPVTLSFIFLSPIGTSRDVNFNLIPQHTPEPFLAVALISSTMMFQHIANGLFGILLAWPLVLGASGLAFPASPRLQQVGQPLQYASLKEFEEIQDQEMMSAPQSMNLFGNNKRWDRLKTSLYQVPVFADLYFDERRAQIQGSFKHFLQETVALLEREQKWGLRIEGHCDSRGTSAYNLARAEYHLTNLTQFFEIMGISSERIHQVNFGQDPFPCQSMSERCQEDNLRAKHIFSILAIRQSQRGCLVRLRIEAGNDWDRAMRYSKQLPYLQRIQVATPPFSSSF